MVIRLPPRMGWPGLVAALALVLAVPLALLATPRWQQDARQAAQALRSHALPPPEPRPLPEPGLPLAGEPAERVVDLLALAIRHGVAVDRTQQRQDSAGPVRRLQLGISARGRYADLRAFIAAALQADAGLALDQVRLQRPTPAAAELGAELQWSLLQPGRVDAGR